MKNKKNKKTVTDVKTQTVERASTIDANIQYFIEKVRKYARKDFTKFSAIVAVMFSVGVWVIKSFWYTYFSGKFSVYKIDKSYIDTNSDNIFLQVMMFASLLIICIVINYTYYKISVADDSSKFHYKRGLRKFRFWVIEILIFSIYFVLASNIPLVDLIKDATPKNLLSFLIIVFFCCFMIKVYAIEFAIQDKIKKKTVNKKINKEVSNESKNKNWIKEKIFLVIVTVAVELVAINVASSRIEMNRCDYKVIMIESEENAETIFDILCVNNNNKYRIYPIVFEDKDCYIVTRLYYEDNEIKIDYNYQRIIEKSGQAIMFVDNIYKIRDVIS